MAEAVLLALSKISIYLAGVATSNMSEQASIMKGLPGKVERIRIQLSIINSAIEQMDTAHHNDSAFKEWNAFVRNLAYRIEDVMDSHSYHAHQQEGKGFLKKLTEGNRPFRTIANEITEIEKDLKVVSDLKDRWLHKYGLVNRYSPPHPVRSYDFEPAEPCRVQDLVGIEDNRRVLTEWLYSNEPYSMAVAVLGEGGLGTTTLAMDVYEREKLKFHAYAFIVVEKTYTMDALLRKLLLKIGSVEQLPSASIDNMNVIELKVEITRKLKGKKCLIVLDNVRDQDVYCEICGVLDSLQANRIVITTRKNHVAALAPPTRLLELQPLSSTDAFDLFCRKALYKLSDNPFQNKLSGKGQLMLKEVATSIVDSCQGLPLAIATIGGMLSSKPLIEQIWSHIYQQLQSELANNDYYLQAILNLSYRDLPGYLRNCFLYCSMFPEDYPISRESIVRLWVAEGYVVVKDDCTPEEMAEKYFMELIRRNMLEVVDNDELGRVSTCKMHDIVRKLALLIAKEEKFGSANDYGAMLLMDRNVRRLSSYGWKDNGAIQVKFPRLRSLVAIATISSSHKMLFSMLSESNFLTVLELQDSAITEMPASVGNLFNLRYIGLRRTKVSSLPKSLEKLSNLQTLDIKQTQIGELPKGIVKVRTLRHILADRFAGESHSDFRHFIGLKAPEGISNLEELQTLETVEANKDLAKQLENLMQLRSVSIDNISAMHCAELFGTLSELPFLSSLLLSARDENEVLCFQTLKPKIHSLHRLIVRGCSSDRTLECSIFEDHGSRLKYLELSWCHLGQHQLVFLGSHLPKLKYFSLSRVQGAPSVLLSPGCFPQLKTLVLKHMLDVNQLEIGHRALPRIKGLYIMSLLNLDKVPEGMESLRSLKKLWLLDLHKDFKTHWDKNGMHEKMKNSSLGTTFRWFGSSASIS